MRFWLFSVSIKFSSLPFIKQTRTRDVSRLPQKILTCLFFYCPFFIFGYILITFLDHTIETSMPIQCMGPYVPTL